MPFQLGATLLDACVLAVLEKGDTYGYVLTQSIKETAEISESTLYPVLRRLQKDNMLTTYDVPYSGRLRRYYAITDGGRRALGTYREDWSKHRMMVEKILFGGEQ